MLILLSETHLCCSKGYACVLVDIRTQMGEVDVDIMGVLLKGETRGVIATSFSLT